ncbi:decaprenyl-phosphate phosphoribosyltransferase [candidate division WWE3 bacterium]|nr:decaprenyl-phosphate phosphoribosyltransferase [candidate division WWE3 bacterium]
MDGENFLITWLRAIRIRQWIKNLIVIAPLIFSGQLLIFQDIIKTLDAFCAFCLASSAVYLFNDLYDQDVDKLHPQKRNRPIASGIISSQSATFVSLLFVVLSLLIGQQLGWLFNVVLSGFFLVNIFYTMGIKKLVIWDVIFLALSFVIRAIGGVVAINAFLSPWLFVLTLFLAVLLALGKRRHELVLLGGNAGKHRRILDKYTVQLFDQLMVVMVTASLMAFMLYTMAEETVIHVGSVKLVYSMPLVLYGLFRYLYLVYRYEQGGNPTETLLSDPPLLMSVILWGVLAVAIIYT